MKHELFRFIVNFFELEKTHQTNGKWDYSFEQIETPSLYVIESGMKIGRFTIFGISSVSKMSKCVFIDIPSKGLALSIIEKMKEVEVLFL